MTETAQNPLETAVITITNIGMSKLWGVREATSSVYSRPAHLPGVKDGGIWLQKALKIRPITVDEEQFERVLAEQASCLDGSPIAAARTQMLWLWHFTSASSKDLRGHRLLSAPEIEQMEQEAQAQASVIRERITPPTTTYTRQQKIENGVEAIEGNPVITHGDLLQQARLIKLQTEVDRIKVRARQEAGELIERREVKADIMHAAAVARGAIESLPAELAAMVPPEMRAEVRHKAELKIRTMLAAISGALSLAAEEEANG